MWETRRLKQRLEAERKQNTELLKKILKIEEDRFELAMENKQLTAENERLKRMIEENTDEKSAED